MIAKTGDVLVHHWAHAVRPEACAAAFESEWHRAWKAQAVEGTQEVAHPTGLRRADVFTSGGFAVEFQASPMTAAEVRSRELDWNKKLVWVMDAREAWEQGRLRVTVRASDNPYLPGLPCSLFWYRAPERIRATSCVTLWDIGSGWALGVGRRDIEGTCLRALGYKLPHTYVRDQIVRGSRWPLIRVTDSRV